MFMATVREMAVAMPKATVTDDQLDLSAPSRQGVGKVVGWLPDR